jgi:hypothetical protein
MSVKVKNNKMFRSLGRMEVEFQTLPKKAFEHWRKITPVDKGNARRKTRLNRKTIEARYPYAKRLDEGHSKQAPNGMLAPTVAFLNKITRRIVRKK